MQTFNYIHEWNRYRQLNRRFSNDDHFFDVEHVFYNDEQETNLFEIAHWDHDLLWRNNEIRFRLERSWKSFEKSFHRYFLELSDRNSRHSKSQETIRLILAANFNSKNETLRSKNSHALNFRLRWSFRQRSNQHNRQKNHWIKTIRSRLIDLRHCQLEDIYFSDQK
jgi:ribosomal protein S10